MVYHILVFFILYDAWSGMCAWSKHSGTLVHQTEDFPDTLSRQRFVPFWKVHFHTFTDICYDFIYALVWPQSRSVNCLFSGRSAKASSRPADPAEIMSDFFIRSLLSMLDIRFSAGCFMAGLLNVANIYFYVTPPVRKMSFLLKEGAPIWELLM